MTRWHAVLARLGGRTPTGRDTVVAGALILLGFTRVPLALIVNDGSFPAPVWVVLAGNLVATVDFATLAMRRRGPRTALTVAVAVALAATSLPALYQGTGLGVLVCAYTVAVCLPRQKAIVALAAGTAVHAIGGIVSVALGGQVHLVVTFWANNGSDPVDLLLASIGSFAVPAMIGFYVRASRLDRESRAEAATAEERGRIARELHDIAAHDLSAIVVQAGAADRLVDRDPAAAREAMRSIRAQGRRTLTALRGLVGILRASDSVSPQPTLSTVDDLVASARRSGLTITLHTRGSVQSLPPATDLAAYRLIQEALTNARKHAPGTSVAVCVEYGTAELVVSVSNSPGSAASAANGEAYGLVGMRERVRHAGGTMTAGPRDGGWRVSARFPS